MSYEADMALRRENDRHQAEAERRERNRRIEEERLAMEQVNRNFNMSREQQRHARVVQQDLYDDDDVPAIRTGPIPGKDYSKLKPLNEITRVDEYRTRQLEIAKAELDLYGIENISDEARTVLGLTP